MLWWKEISVKKNPIIIGGTSVFPTLQKALRNAFANPELRRLQRCAVKRLAELHQRCRLLILWLRDYIPYDSQRIQRIGSFYVDGKT